MTAKSIGSLLLLCFAVTACEFDLRGKRGGGGRERRKRRGGGRGLNEFTFTEALSALMIMLNKGWGEAVSPAPDRNKSFLARYENR